MPRAGDPKKALAPWLVGNVSSKGEQRLRCPLHNDNSPSASVNWPKGVWQCLGCKARGTVSNLVSQVAALPPPAARTAPKRKRSGAPSADRVPLSEARIAGYHAALMAEEERLTYLMETRMLREDTIVRHKLGWDPTFGKTHPIGKRYTIPVYDTEDRLVNIRRYRGLDSQRQKFLNEPGYGVPPRLYPAVPRDATHVIVCEGELDALVAQQLVDAIDEQFVCTSGTHGSSTWEPSFTQALAGRHVWLCYDNDDEGIKGARAAAQHLVNHCAAVHIMKPLSTEDHGDVTDWVRDEGGTPEEFVQAVKAAEQFGVKVLPQLTNAEPVAVQVIGSMDASTNGAALNMAVTVTGRRDPTYSVPRRVDASCTMDAGPKCRGCPMYQEYLGGTEVVVNEDDAPSILRYIDSSESEIYALYKRQVGIPNACNVVRFTPLENQSVEELYVMTSVDRQADKDTDYTQRKVYNVGGYDTRTNAAALLVGTTAPSPKDRHNEFVAWHLEPETTSIDNFQVTPDLVDELTIFQPDLGQRPLDKCWDIACDLSANVTKIIGRERLHMAMDLVFHSLLHFPFDGKTISRGWLELLVVGDTRTGKSETAIMLTQFYELGHVIGCEGASFAGLVGGVKQIGKAWVTSWGEITVNDRRLVVLDEASGLSPEVISQLSDVRSRGLAQITKIESQQTNARCRAIWISNPRKSRFVDEQKHDGIDVIEDLIGNPEDIARFDFAMSVSMKDVDSRAINNPDRPRVPHVYTSELCRSLILWAWSRKAEDVVWQPAGLRYVYRMAEKLGDTFVDHPPLVQRTNVREKIARLAVALAARTFSTDRTGTKVIVTKEHVWDAVQFLYKLYSYDNFGYLRLSKRMARNRELARTQSTDIKKFLRTEPRLLEFLLDRRGSFRSQDLEEMAHMDRNEVNLALGRLSDAKMVSKTKSQIIIEPELRAILKEVEDNGY